MLIFPTRLTYPTIRLLMHVILALGIAPWAFLLAARRACTGSASPCFSCSATSTCPFHDALSFKVTIFCLAKACLITPRSKKGIPSSLWRSIKWVLASGAGSWQNGVEDFWDLWGTVENILSEPCCIPKSANFLWKEMNLIEYISVNHLTLIISRLWDLASVVFPWQYNVQCSAND